MRAALEAVIGMALIPALAVLFVLLCAMVL